MNVFKKASLVIGPDGVRCIYEIEGSGQKYVVSHPFTKKAVSITPVKNQDVRDTLELMGVLKEGKVSTKGINIISEKFIDELKTVKGPTDRIKLEVLGIVLNNRITPLGIDLLQNKMMEEMAIVTGGNLAINESGDKETLLKIEY